MAFLKGKRPGETYHQLVAVKDPSTGDFVLSRDDQSGNAEAIPVWVKMTNGEALKVQADNGQEVFVVDTASNKAILTTLEIQGSITNGSDATTKDYVDTEIALSTQEVLYVRTGVEHSTLVAAGWRFEFPDAAVPINGSVQVIVNGVYYLSNTDQTRTDPVADFHISTSTVIIHNKAYGGTINLIPEDEIGVYYQKTIT